MAKAPKAKTDQPDLLDQDSKPEPQLMAGIVPPEEEVEVEVDAQPNQEEAAKLLQKQIDDLKAAEASQRQQAQDAIRQRDEALKKARESDSKVSQSQIDAYQAKYDSVTAAIAAATAEAGAAKRDIRIARDATDVDAEIEAQDRLARALGNLAYLENGKSALEDTIAQEKERAKQQAAKPAPVSNDPLEGYNLPETAKNWLKAHPEYLTDARKNARIQALHNVAVAEGYDAFSPEYYDFFEIKLGLKQAPNTQQQQESQARTQIVSAPVSREVSSSSGQRPSGSIKLTLAQAEAAKIAGISAAEYARQLQKLAEHKANGQYVAGGN